MSFATRRRGAPPRDRRPRLIRLFEVAIRSRRRSFVRHHRGTHVTTVGLISRQVQPPRTFERSRHGGVALGAAHVARA